MKFSYIFLVLVSGVFASNGFCALSLDRTRIILNESEHSLSFRVTNRNESDPYLAQGWIEDSNEQQIDKPLMVVPPVQRIDAGSYSLLRLLKNSNAQDLPKDRESLFYLNLREIPPKSDKKNVLMLAVQTRIKIFWRPDAIRVKKSDETIPGINAVTINKQGSLFRVYNPTPYFITVVGVESGKKIKMPPFMVPPKGNSMLDKSVTELSHSVILTIVNDYGSPVNISFSCQNNSCQVDKVIKPER